MNEKLSRRRLLAKLSLAAFSVSAAPVASAAKATVQKILVRSDAPKNYVPTKHKWQMAIDANRCIGCGHCAEACKN